MRALSRRYAIKKMHSSRPTVLLVDDEQPIRDVLKQLLEYHGFCVHAADNGRAALEIVRGAVPVDVIITDNCMPELKGTDMIRRLRGDAFSGRIILHSGHLTEREAIEIAPMVDIILPKPASLADILDAVRCPASQP